ncbi:MAG: hypothetical protein LBE62_08480 [Azonexus sp.]|jgi:phenylacetate-CoA ligase|nr:hypothetical protein [Azonexus sp.]
MEPDENYLEAIETAPREEIERIQQERLLEQVAYVYERSPLVREAWRAAGVSPKDIRSTADFLAKAPFIDKDMVRHYRDTHNDPFGGIVCTDLGNVSCIGSSGGTTGDPTLFAEQWDAPGEWTNFFQLRDYWGYGLRPGDYVAQFQIVMRGDGRRLYHELNTTTIDFSHDPAELGRFAEWALKFRPSFLFHLSTPLIYGLERLERETSVDLKDVFSSFKACIYGGEYLGARPRALLDRWQVPMYEFGALGDSGTIHECTARQGMHAWEDLALVEVLDPVTMQPAPDGGRGELVVTSLTDPTDPLIRFRSGDYVEYTRERCRCGRTHMRLWVLGRLGDEVMIGDKAILPKDVWPAIESVEETSAGLFQIIRTHHTMERLTLRVGYDGDPDTEDLKRRVADAVERQLGLCPEIELEANREMVKRGPPHKIPRVAKS